MLVQSLDEEVGEEPVFEGIAFEGFFFGSAGGEDDAALGVLAERRPPFGV